MKKIPLLSLVLLLILSACRTPYVTNTARSGVEQLLISTAADRSINKLELDFLKGETVFLDPGNLESLDKGYVLGTVKSHLARHGALVLDEKSDADIHIELYSGALATDGDDFLIGIPAMGLPVPMAGTLETPEIAIIKKISQFGVSKLAFHGYRKEDRKLVFASDPLSGSAFYHRWTLLFFGFQHTDLPGKPHSAQSGKQKINPEE